MKKTPRKYTRKEDANALQAAAAFGGVGTQATIGSTSSRGGVNSTRGKRKRAAAAAAAAAELEATARTVIASNPFDDDPPQVAPHHPHHQHHQQHHLHHHQNQQPQGLTNAPHHHHPHLHHHHHHQPPLPHSQNQLAQQRHVAGAPQPMQGPHPHQVSHMPMQSSPHYPSSGPQTAAAPPPPLLHQQMQAQPYQAMPMAGTMMRGPAPLSTPPQHMIDGAMQPVISSPQPPRHHNQPIHGSFAGPQPVQPYGISTPPPPLPQTQQIAQQIPMQNQPLDHQHQHLHHQPPQHHHQSQHHHHQQTPPLTHQVQAQPQLPPYSQSQPPPSQQQSVVGAVTPQPSSQAQLPPQQQQMLTCAECRQLIYANEPHMMCRAGCEAFYHRHCSGLTEFACELLLREPAAEWACNRCICGDRRIPVVRMQHQHDSRQSVWL